MLITSGRRISTSKATMGTGSTRLSTTWLTISACVAFTPQATTAKDGAIVRRRRSHSGMRKPTKPCGSSGLSSPPIFSLISS